MTASQSTLFENEDGRVFNCDRLTLARERNGLTKQELAELCGVTPRTVSSWEKGAVEAPPVELLSSALNFPEAFFFADDPLRIPESAVSFRALTAMSARQVARSLSWAAFAREFSQWVDDRYGTPAADVPDIADLTFVEAKDQPNPVETAESLRSLWGLADRPISDMLRLLESHGVRVYSIPGEDREVDAFSFWQDDRPYIFVNATKSAERVRFDLAHELGHLCMHRGQRTNREKSFELAANNFASSFLIPATPLYAQISRTLTLADVMALKRFWMVSASAMVRRLRTLECISPWHYRTWMIELNQRGYGDHEPDGIRPESSTLLKKVLILAREDGWSIARLARHLCLPVTEIENFLHGLTIAPVSSDGKWTPAPPKTGHLTRVV